MNNKNQQIKNIVAKIDIEKITNYLQEHSTSKSLKEIVKYSKRVQDSNNDQEIFKLGTALAFDLDTICDTNKTNYVKDEAEKKHWLEISRELFENTIGVREQK